MRKAKTISAISDYAQKQQSKFPLVAEIQNRIKRRGIGKILFFFDVNFCPIVVDLDGGCGVEKGLVCNGTDVLRGKEENDCVYHGASAIDYLYYLAIIGEDIRNKLYVSLAKK